MHKHQLFEMLMVYLMKYNEQYVFNYNKRYTCILPLLIFIDSPTY